MRHKLAVLVVLVLLGGPAAAQQTHQTLPLATALFLTAPQNFLLNRVPNRLAEVSQSLIVVAGVYATTAGLTATPSAPGNSADLMQGLSSGGANTVADLRTFSPIAGQQTITLSDPTTILSAGGQAGARTRVTDDVQGVRMDQGTRWAALSGGVVNVLDVGAKCDGTTDDTAAIQAAFNLGYSVYFPPGTCIVSQVSFAAHGQMAFGSGPLSILKRINNSPRNGPILISNGSNSVVVRDLQFDGNRLNNTRTTHDQTGVYFQGVHGGLISHVLTHDNQLSGIYVSRSVNIRIDSVESWNSINSTYPSAPQEFAVLLSHDVALTNCIAHHSGNSGFVISDSYNVTNTNWLSHSNVSAGHEVVASTSGANQTHDVALIGGVTHHNGTSGILVAAFGSAGYPDIYSLTITGNSSYSNSGSGMQTVGNRSTYSNNVIHSNAWSGIWHVSGSDNVFNGNTIDSNNTLDSSSGGVPFSGIDFQNLAGYHNTIIGNTIHNGGTGHQAHSVAIRGSNVNWTYIGPNHWYSGATVTALYDQGSATMVHVPSGPGAATYGPNVTLDASFGDTFNVIVTDTQAFTITPINIHFKGHLYTIRLKNTSGGRMGAQTWSPIYKIPTYVAPANNYSKSFTFLDDGINLICVGYTIADVPN